MSTMPSLLDVAVWGSLIATALLGLFMLFQAFVLAEHRRRFIVFGLVCLLIAAIDFSRPLLDLLTYEYIRVFCWSAYGVAVLFLFNFGWPWVLAAALSLPALGMGVWYGLNPELATTVVVPLTYLVAMGAHIHQYFKKSGYSSCILSTQSLVMAILCAYYYQATTMPDNEQTIIFGYFHFCLVNIITVIFGWIHIPRELQGRSPVKINLSMASAYFLINSGAGLISGWGLLNIKDHPMIYVSSAMVMIASTLILYFHSRHQLVIHTDNVSQLLDERTSSLKEARIALTHQNQIQAEMLKEQEKELEAKSTVIQRQRRLELAAQTAGESAHDIQNLITPMINHLEVIQQQNQSDDEVQNAAQAMSTQIHQLLELNTQLLTLSRRGRLDLHPVNLRELVAEIHERYSHEPRIQCQSHAVWINGSWSQLSRALSNLVSNALDATDQRDVTNKQIEIRCGVSDFQAPKRCHLGFMAAGRYAYLQVEDHGKGIPDTIIEQIFEPFFSSKKGSDRSGSGLGLSIVNAVTEDHKGVLDLQSSAEGTCFTLYFEPIEAPENSDDASQLLGNETVLVTDDDSSVRNHCAKLLSDHGYNVFSAEDGRQALEMLQVQEYDLILLDLNMPRMTGYDTFFAALHLRPGVKVVVHSSYISSSEANKLQLLGVMALLQKPASKLQLLKTVRHALDGQSAEVTAGRFLS